MTMELYSTLAGAGWGGGALGRRAALAVSASAAIFFCGSEPGCTTPADMIRVAASSALISISMILLFGTKKKNPVVGFGAQGRNTEMCSSLPGMLSAISSLGACEISTIDHMPGDGNSTRPTRRKLDPLPENNVSNTCLRLR